MTIQEQLVEKLSHLSPGDQRRVLEFVTRLERPELRRRIAAGLAEADRGELLDADAVFAEVEGSGQSPRKKLPRWPGKVIGTLSREQIYAGDD